MKKTFITENIYTSQIKNTSLALGFFDGVHIGHKKVLKTSIEYAKNLGITSTVLTFKNHPVEVLYNVKPEFITTVDERIELFKHLGFDNIIMADFTKEISQMPPKEYFEKIIWNLTPKVITSGYNHTFGANKAGNTDYLAEVIKNKDCILNVISSVKIKNDISSSTLIRNLIKNGEVDIANKFLEGYYCVKNNVIKGMQRGRLLNFPTANIKYPENKVLPRLGVYYGISDIKGRTYNSVANIGIRPTFGDIKEPLLEVNILDFDSNIYGEELKFCFVKKIRDEIKFSSEKELKEQIKKDVDFVRNNCL